MKFLKIFGIIFSFFAVIMLIIWLVKMNNAALSGKEASFVGISDFYYYFSTIDSWQPFYEFMGDVNSITSSFAEALKNFENISDWNSFWGTLGNFMPSFANMITIPFRLIWYVLKWIWFINSELFRFYDFMIS